MGLEQDRKIDRLRELEIIGYRLCYGLLQSERLAHEAAKELLLRLFRDSRIFAGAAAACEAKLLRREAAEVCRIYMSQAAVQ
ncbi:hypothetical protein [Paenibacillus gorillae]|uniref:hypothetical protein n=1 Tax=Paenibacillus gorillae TaxID=1243662 RepID=UPI0004B3C1AF|nr:hypothetical protein [Paenibacillus gorillae]